MSVKTVEREVTITKPIRVYGCDGPECSVTREVPDMLKVMEVSPGWIFVRKTTATDPAVAGDAEHYCSHFCLADALVP